MNQLVKVLSVAIGIILCGVLPGLSGAAIPPALATPALQPPQQVVQLQRNPDYACTQCHKDENHSMQGEHGRSVNPNSHLNVTCSNCHGKASIHHRDGVADVMRFGPQQEMYTPVQQNSVCLSCHQPDQLRAAFWPHDVHVLKIACTSCHQLHPKRDPMQGLDERGKVKLCVDCHSTLHNLDKGQPGQGKQP